MIRIAYRHVGGTVGVALLAAALVGFFPASGAAQQGFSRLEPDTHRIIVHGTPDRVRAIALRFNVPITRQLSIGGVVEVSSSQLELLRHEVDGAYISADAVVNASMAVSTTAIGADQLWGGTATAAGVTGRGVGIAVLDSGIGAHPDLAGRIIASVDFVDPSGNGGDAYGHGTHTAGIAAGRPATDDGLYPGVAPGAHLLDLRVLDADGRGHASNVIAAIDWAIANKERYAIRVLNLSLGGPVTQTYQNDPMVHAVERAVAHGLVVVCSAGNLGRTDDDEPIIGGITSPGSAPSAVTVGALNTFGTAERSDDAVASFSSRGPTAFDYLIKPDVVAPGNRIVSAQAAGSYLPVSYPEQQVPGGYLALSGTSMAAAVVSGVAALLLEANPALTPSQVKVAIQATASPVEGAGITAAGAGSVNVVSALYAALAGPIATAPPVEIGGEPQEATGLVFAAVSRDSVKPRWGKIRNANDLDQAISANNTVLRLGRSHHEAPDTGRDQASQVQRAGADPVRGNTIVWGRNPLSSGLVGGNTIVWGRNPLSSGLVGGNTIVWGRNPLSSGPVDGNTIAWGRSALSSGPVGGNTIVWGRNPLSSEPVGGNTIVWGRNPLSSGPVGGNTIVWGRNPLSSGPVGGNTIVWVVTP